MLSVLVALSCCIGAVYGDGQPPDGVHIDSLTYHGTGCPTESVTSAISEDGTAFSLIFNEYVASMKTGGSLEDTERHCQINVGLRVPEGWSYSVKTVDYRGYAELEQGTYASRGTLYYFSDEQTERLSVRVNGPDTGEYSVQDSFPEVVWSECGAGADLTIKSDILVVGDNARYTVDTTDFGLEWQEC